MCWLSGEEVSSGTDDVYAGVAIPTTMSGVDCAVRLALAAARVVVAVLHSVSVSTSSRVTTTTVVETRVVVAVDLTTLVVEVEYTVVDE